MPISTGNHGKQARHQSDADTSCDYTLNSPEITQCYKLTQEHLHLHLHLEHLADAFIQSDLQ